jgi:aspartokinase
MLIMPLSFAKHRATYNRGCPRAFFTELHWAIDEAEPSRYDYHYDQMVPVGELLSTRLFSLLLEEQAVKHHWLDARDPYPYR